MTTEGSAADRFKTPEEVVTRLRDVDYLADDAIASTVFLADRLRKPVLVEGPAGTGKTQLAKSVAELTGSRLIRLQCYEGLDESKALYEWNYRKQLLRIQASQVGSVEGPGWAELEEDIFAEDFLLTRPLARGHPSRRAGGPADRRGRPRRGRDRGAPARDPLRLPGLDPRARHGDGQQIPLVFLTSNNTRELSEALKRRCLFLHIDYPDLEREREIVLTRVPGISDRARRPDRAHRALASASMDLRKAPSVSETLDWARTLVVLGRKTIQEEDAVETLHVLLKYQTDIDKARRPSSPGSVARRRKSHARDPQRVHRGPQGVGAAHLDDRALGRGRRHLAHRSR